MQDSKVYTSITTKAKPEANWHVLRLKHRADAGVKKMDSTLRVTKEQMIFLKLCSVPLRRSAMWMLSFAFVYNLKIGALSNELFVSMGTINVRESLVLKGLTCILM